MKLIDLLRLSWTNLRGNRLRTILTVMGVGIGIGAIVFLVTLGLGLQKVTIEKITQSAALTTLDVNLGSSSLLKLDDQTVADFQKIDHVESVSESISSSGQVTFNGITTDCAIKGVDKNSIDWEGIKISPEKILLSFAKAEENDPRAIISRGVLKLIDVKNKEEIIGKKITFDIYIPKEDDPSNLTKLTRDFTISDIMENETPIAYIDIKELKSMGIKNYTIIKVKVDGSANIPFVKDKISQKGYNVTSIADLIGQIERAFKYIQLVLGGFGIIALLVASIGMFNTMTIALLERTRDIGIMKAIGARKKDIRRMFIFEAAIIGFIGGIVGVGGGYFLGIGINGVINGLAKNAGADPVKLFNTPWQFVLGVLVFALAVGLITGIYPARRAARINSLEALRYE